MKGISEWSPFCPMNYEFSKNQWWEQELFLAMCGRCALFPFPFDALPQALVVFSHACTDQVSAEYSTLLGLRKRRSYRWPVLSLMLGWEHAFSTTYVLNGSRSSHLVIFNSPKTLHSLFS